MVKNEMDIIESFVRYNANIMDGMIILDNGSSDDTLSILNKLKNENFPIFVFEDVDKEFDKVAKMTCLLKKAVEEFDADIIVPLDADEFIISTTAGNPREFLEDIEADTYHKILWRTYIPYLGKKKNEKFIPSRITFARDENIDKSLVIANQKVIIPKNLVTDYDVIVARGSHDLIYKSKFNDSIKQINNDNLRIAHFPIRSTEHAISKITIGWINALSNVERKENQSLHWKKIFDQIKSNEKISEGDIIKFASEYAVSDRKLGYNKLEVNFYEDPFDLSFCENIEIKYTDKKINPIANLLEFCEDLSLDYLNLKKDIIAENEGPNLEMKSFAQKLILKFPTLQIFFNRNNNGIKQAIMNVRGYKSIKKNKLFDPLYYLDINTDVKTSGANPLIHYILHGFKEGRQPNASFDGDYYLESHPDVVKSNLNPLVHYSLHELKKVKMSSYNRGFELVNKKSFRSSNNDPNGKIAIKVPAPSWNVVSNWGDYHFALALKKEFEKKNYETVIQMVPEWDENEDVDVVLVLRGLVKYDPKPEHFNVMWNISHPDKIDIDEYNEYDHVFVASEPWANELKNKVKVPVEPLLQCTDPELFYPEPSEKYEHELLFVGNNKKIPRKIIKDLLPTQKDFGLYGNFWYGHVEEEYYCGSHIPNNELHTAYSSCKILLNDHHDDMREKGFISNRIFDGFASGAFIISDNVKGADTTFGDALITYEEANELHRLVDYYLENDEERKTLLEKGRNMVLSSHTFEKRVESILEVVNNNSKHEEKETGEKDDI